MNEVNVRATKDQIHEFLESILWKDIKRELGAWKTGFKNEMMSIVRPKVKIQALQLSSCTWETFMGG
jgi:hypothetical protein